MYAIYTNILVYVVDMLIYHAYCPGLVLLSKLLLFSAKCSIFSAKPWREQVAFDEKMLMPALY
jgi:hypothetical protein